MSVGKVLTIIVFAIFLFVSATVDTNAANIIVADIPQDLAVHCEVNGPKMPATIDNQLEIVTEMMRDTLYGDMDLTICVTKQYASNKNGATRKSDNTIYILSQFSYPTRSTLAHELGHAIHNHFGFSNEFYENFVYRQDLNNERESFAEDFRFWRYGYEKRISPAYSWRFGWFIEMILR